MEGKKRRKNTADVAVVELASYNAPKIQEYRSDSGDYVTYGEANYYFSYINECYRKSTTNRSIINSIILQIYGKGLKATDFEDESEQMNYVNELFSKKVLKNAIKDLKQYGQCALQVGYNKEHTKIIKVEYTPIQTIAIGKKDKKGKINFYYYMADWNQSYRDDPKKIPAFGTSKKQLEILYINEPASGNFYYADVDYQPALPYCQVEEEVASFHINNVKNAFTPSMLINFNNGIPTEKKQGEIERKINTKFAGANNTSKIVIAFNDSAEQAATMEAPNITGIDKIYEYTSTEARDKILMAHRITSPILVGIRDGSGLGNNADELKTSYSLFNMAVIDPFREIFLDGLLNILEFNGLELDLYFDPLMPSIFTEEVKDNVPANTQEEKESIEKETGVKMSEEEDRRLRDILEFYAEDAPEGYEVHKVEDNIDEEEIVNYEALYNEMNSELSATQKSKQDSPMYKVRYTYHEVKASADTRPFCRNMLSLASQGKVFRKEDIVAMGNKGLNSQFSPSGQSKYSIWLYKGGVNCHHVWRRIIYKKQKEGMSGNPMQNVDKISVEKAKREGFRPETNDSKVSIAPINMPNKGRKS